MGRWGPVEDGRGRGRSGTGTVEKGRDKNRNCFCILVSKKAIHLNRVFFYFVGEKIQSLTCLKVQPSPMPKWTKII